MNKKLIIYLLAGSLLLLTTVTQAQVRFSIGPQVALTRATIHYQDPQYFPASYRTGFEAGLVSTIAWGHFALQPAVRYAQKGYHVAGTYTYPDNLPPYSFETQADYRLNYLTIPLNFLYTQQPTGQGVQVFAGPYLSVLVGGHYEAQTTYLNASHALVKEGRVVAGDVGGTVADEASSRRVDAGLQAGVGYRYGATLLQASYSLGLRNLASDTQLTPVATPNAQEAYYNRAFQLSFAYLFGPKS
jgi:hypothetical protein